MESMMTARQVAELLGVHENWVYDQAASGELPSYKIGGTRRFDRDELRGWSPSTAKRGASERCRTSKPRGPPDGRKTGAVRSRCMQARSRIGEARCRRTRTMPGSRGCSAPNQ
jgi:excisionase family DNA binding protein